MKAIKKLFLLINILIYQQKLYDIHLKETNNHNEISSKKNSKKSLEVCKTCQQVLLGKDFAPHTQSHTLDNTFTRLKTDDSTSVKSKK
jgi:predicted metal-binding protein